LKIHHGCLGIARHALRSFASGSHSRSRISFLWTVTEESVSADLSDAGKNKSRQGDLYVSHGDIKEHSSDEVNGDQQKPY
jgi:hypothetical protein